MDQNNELLASSIAEEIIEGPLESVSRVVNFLSSVGEVMKKRALVIPKPPTGLILITRDSQVRVDIDNLGRVGTTFRPQPTSLRHFILGLCRWG